MTCETAMVVQAKCAPIIDMSQVQLGGVSTPPLPLPEYDHEVSILCAPNGDRVRVVHTWLETNASGAPDSTTLFNLTTGANYAGLLSALTQCPDIDQESDGEDWCAGGVDYTKHILKSNGVPTGVVYWVNNATNATVPAPAGATKGKCLTPIVERELITGKIRVTNQSLGDGMTEVPSGWNFAMLSNGGANLKSYSYKHIANGDYGSSVEHVADGTKAVFSAPWHDGESDGQDLGNEFYGSINPKIIFEVKGRALFEIKYQYWA